MSTYGMMMMMIMMLMLVNENCITAESRIASIYN